MLAIHCLNMEASAATAKQPSLFEDEEKAGTDAAHSQQDQLLTDSHLYRDTKECQRLLDFVVGLLTFAPFNAMLLQIQKPAAIFRAAQ